MKRYHHHKDIVGKTIKSTHLTKSGKELVFIFTDDTCYVVGMFFTSCIDPMVDLKKEDVEKIFGEK